MIFTDRKITIRNGKSSINEPVILYRGDFEVSIRFTIMESKFRFKSGVNLVDSEKASYGQLAILAPYGGNVFSEVVKCEDGTVTFTLTKEMIDQLEEVGLYSFQIRLFDYYKESRVSIPPVEFGIEVREPVASEDHDNEVNNAIVGYSIAKVVNPKEENVGDTFDDSGNYNKTEWKTGDRISQGKLNKIEDAIDKINQNEKKDVAALDKRVTNNFNILDSNKADKNEIFSMSNMGQDIKEAMTGGSVAVVGVNAVLTDNIMNGQVTPEKTNFVVRSGNLFDKDTVSELGWWIETVHGTPQSNEYTTTLRYSDYIVIEPGVTYRWNGGSSVHSYCIYDRDKKFLYGKKDLFEVSAVFEAPAAYIRLTIRGTITPEEFIFTSNLPVEAHLNQSLTIKNLDVAAELEYYRDDIESIPNMDAHIAYIERSLSNSFQTETTRQFVRKDPSYNWQYTNSIFSGWGSNIGCLDGFNTISFKIRPRDIAVTIIEMDLLEESVLGKLIYHERYIIESEPFTEKEIVWTLPEIYRNVDMKNLYFTYQCNQLIDLAQVPKNEYSGDDNVSASVYQINGSFEDPKYMATVSNEEILGGDYSGHPNLYIEASYTYDKYDANPEGKVDMNAFYNTFDKSDVFVVDYTNGDGTETYDTSIFSGWGGHIGTCSKITALKFAVRNRDEMPTTKIGCTITEFNRTGAILARKILDVNIPIGEKQEIIWVLDEPILNPENKNLFFSYSCDTVITKVATLLDQNADNIVYGWNTYTISKDPNYFPMYFTDVLGTSGGLSTVWVETGEIISKYLLKNTSQDDPIEPQEPVRENIRVVLPDKFVAVVGDRLQLFYRGLVEAVNPYNYDIRVRCKKGGAYPRYFDYTPAAGDVGVYDFSIEVYDNHKNLLGSGTTKLHVIAVGESPTVTKNVLCIGDSLTSGGYWCSEAMRRLTATDGKPTGHGKNNINFIGTKSNSTGCKWEGYGGWTWASYLSKPSATTSDIWFYCTHDKTIEDQHSVWRDTNGSKWSLETIENNRLKFTRYQSHTNMPPATSGTLYFQENAVHTSDIIFTDYAIADGNPFWDVDTNRVNFKAYCETNGFDGIDYVYTLLTWNGGRVDKAEIKDNASEMQYAKQLIDIIHSDYPNAKIRLMGIQLPSLNGGTGGNYGANGGYADCYGLVRGVFGLNLTYQAIANDDNYKDFVEFVNVSGEFDSEYNMPQSLYFVNARSTIQEYRGTNGVHPSQEGYLQIGDVAYRWMVKDLLE